MTQNEREEFRELVEEEVQFKPEKGQKWILTLEERHPVGHDILFHVYSQKGKYYLIAHEIVDVLALDVRTRQHALGETLSGNLRIHLSTLRAELPAAFAHEPEAVDRSHFQLRFLNNKKAEVSYAWDFPTGNFKRIKPVLTLIWAVDEWRHGAKVMGWSHQKPREAKSLNERAQKRETSGKAESTGRKGRIDPFGSIW